MINTASTAKLTDDFSTPSYKVWKKVRDFKPPQNGLSLELNNVHISLGLRKFEFPLQTAKNCVSFKFSIFIIANYPYKCACEIIWPVLYLAWINSHEFRVTLFKRKMWTVFISVRVVKIVCQHQDEYLQQNWKLSN